jgi:hypothetical protein
MKEEETEEENGPPSVEDWGWMAWSLDYESGGFAAAIFFAMLHSGVLEIFHLEMMVLSGPHGDEFPQLGLGPREITDCRAFWRSLVPTCSVAA